MKYLKTLLILMIILSFCTSSLLIAQTYQVKGQTVDEEDEDDLMNDITGHTARFFPDGGTDMASDWDTTDLVVDFVQDWPQSISNPPPTWTSNTSVPTGWTVAPNTWQTTTYLTNGHTYTFDPE